MKRKCGMYYNVYIPWMYKNGLEDRLDEDDKNWYNNTYLLKK